MVLLSHDGWGLSGVTDAIGVAYYSDRIHRNTYIIIIVIMMTVKDYKK